MSPDVDVLLIDDEAVIRQAVLRVLERTGLRVAEAGKGAAGLAHPAAETCRAVVCDLILPDMSGADVVRELRRRRPELPIVVITGYASGEAVSRAEDAGASSFLAKPFDDAELLAVVRVAVDAGSHAKEEP
jgi:DNA-binding NtrC family response regulator